MDELKKKLQELASKKLSFANEEDHGFNYDEAYSMGWDDGEIALARSLLKEFFKDG